MKFAMWRNEACHVKAEVGCGASSTDGTRPACASGLPVFLVSTTVRSTSVGIACVCYKPARAAACSVRETSPFGAQLAAAFTPKLCHYGGFQASLACNDSLAPSLVIQGVGGAVLSVLNAVYTSWCLYSTTPVLKGICTRQRLYLRQGTAFLVPYVISRDICRNPAWQMCFNPCTFILIVISICRILWS